MEKLRIHVNLAWAQRLTALMKFTTRKSVSTRHPVAIRNDFSLVKPKVVKAHDPRDEEWM